MRKKNIFVAVILALSLIGCGKQEADSIVETVSEVKDMEIATEETENESEAVMKESVETVEEVGYTECGDLYMLDSGRNDGTQVDMSSWENNPIKYVTAKSINVYYTDTSLAGYTKENATILVALSNSEWNFCIFDKSGYLVKTEDLVDAVLVDDREEEFVYGEPVKEPVPAESAEQPKAEESVIETPTVVESNKYTPEEAIAVYRSLVEAGGMTWNPDLKGVTSWGTGWIYLDKGQPEWAASANLESFAMGDTVGNPCTEYYLEVTGSDENAVYITEWTN